MPAELTVIYYSANRIEERFAEKVRRHLEETAAGLPIISVTQKPVALGRNICLGDIGFSTWNVYWQVLVGAMHADTPWVACAEDDTLYTDEHFAARPPHDVFWYNLNRWWVEPQAVYRWRNRAAMMTCVASRSLMVETLSTRFKAYPEPIFDKKKLRSWGEPGRYEGNLNLPQVRREMFSTMLPVVTFDHKGSLYGIRRWNKDDRLERELPHWGPAADLIEEFCA
jgi:hypothetical protein